MASIYWLTVVPTSNAHRTWPLSRDRTVASASFRQPLLAHDPIVVPVIHIRAGGVARLPDCCPRPKADSTESACSSSAVEAVLGELSLDGEEHCSFFATSLEALAYRVLQWATKTTRTGPSGRYVRTCVQR